MCTLGKENTWPPSPMQSGISSGESHKRSKTKEIISKVGCGVEDVLDVIQLPPTTLPAMYGLDVLYFREGGETGEQLLASDAERLLASSRDGA